MPGMVKQWFAQPLIDISSVVAVAVSNQHAHIKRW
jgi:hypothetical protein